MSDHLQLLKPTGRGLLAPDQYEAGIPTDLAEHVSSFNRVVPLGPLRAMVDLAMRQHVDTPARSDGWLAPRVHACVRLHRREAADLRLWHFLSLAFRDYVIWRWKGDVSVPDERIRGASNRHALARLWWGAELTRNGADYTATERAFRLQEIIQWILDVEAFQNRPAALAYVQFLGDQSTGKRAREVAMRLNHALTTIMLDVLAPDIGSDAEDVERWIRQELEPDETRYERELPDGPDEAQVETNTINRVVQLLERIAEVPVVSATEAPSREASEVADETRAS